MGAGKRNDRHGPARQRGSSAVEFALVFGLFFLVMYGSITYGMIFALKHSLTQAANEGARAALRDVDDREALASTTATKAIEWLGHLAPTPKVTSGDCTLTTTPPTTYTCLTVSLTYEYGAHPIIPRLPLPGLGYPATITAQATVQLI